MIVLPLVPSGSTPIASARRVESTNFLIMLPTIRRVARYAFRRLPRDQREDATQEVIATCFVSYLRLVHRGRQQFAFATPLAQFAVRQYRAGRRTGCCANRYDVTSPYCRQCSGIAVESLFQRDSHRRWQELLIQDKRSSPADIAVIRLDFVAWLKQLDRKQRKAAKLLAGGARTREAALQLRLSPARVSQLRRELKQNWCSFQGEAADQVG